MGSTPIAGTIKEDGLHHFDRWSAISRRNIMQAITKMGGTLIPLILLILVMYFLLIRPQKKREKAVNEMRSSLHVGDEIITIGGICGKIVKTREETIVVQVGAEKVKFEMMRWSVSKVVDSKEKKDIRKADAETEVEASEPAEEKKTSRPKRLVKEDVSASEKEEPAEGETEE